MTHSIIGIALVAVISAAIVWAEHYDPWHISAPWTYVAGCLAIFVPVSTLWLLWGSWWEIVSLWSAACTSGLVVFYLYKRDGKENELDQLKGENEQLKASNDALTEEISVWRGGGQHSEKIN